MYVLSEDLATRLLKMLRWYERMKDTGPDGEMDDGGMLNLQFVQLDGSAATTSGGIDYYSGSVVLFDASTATFLTLGACRLIDANDTALDVDGIFPALQTGNKSVSGTTLPLFVTACGCL